jgi:hypothetical protein
MTRSIVALAVAAVLADALAGCETPKDRDARICATAADPVAIANQAGSRLVDNELYSDVTVSLS